VDLLRPKNILVVEDDVDHRQSLGAALPLLGYEVLDAGLYRVAVTDAEGPDRRGLHNGQWSITELNRAGLEPARGGHGPVE
jgi:hypothetical protein